MTAENDPAPAASLPRDALIPAHVALLDQNWMAVNECLSEVIRLNTEHRAGGCSDWYCGSPALTALLASLDLPSAVMVAQAAIERLTPRPGHGAGHQP